MPKLRTMMEAVAIWHRVHPTVLRNLHGQQGVRVDCITLHYPTIEVVLQEPRGRNIFDTRETYVWCLRCARCNVFIPRGERARLAITLYGEMSPANAQRDKEFSVFCHRLCAYCAIPLRDSDLPPADGKPLVLHVASERVLRVVQRAVMVAATKHPNSETNWSDVLVKNLDDVRTFMHCISCGRDLGTFSIYEIVMLPEFTYEHRKRRVGVNLRYYCTRECAWVENQIRMIDSRQAHSNIVRSHALRTLLLEVMELARPAVAKTLLMSPRCRVILRVPLLPFHHRAWGQMDRQDLNRKCDIALTLFLDSIGLPLDENLLVLFCKPPPASLINKLLLLEEKKPPSTSSTVVVEPNKLMGRLVRRKRRRR